MSYVQAGERAVPSIPPADQRLRVIIDTDAACEIDDLYALALAVLSSDRLELEGIIAAHYGDFGGPQGVEKSFQLVNEVLDRAGLIGKIPVKRGSHPFRYSSVPEESEGVDFIIERAMADDPRPLWVVSLGPCTDMAAAYLKKPKIASRVVAFWHGRTKWPTQCWNFNSVNDVKAVRIVFSSRLPLVLFDTGTHLTCSMEETAERLAPYGELGKMLHEYRYKDPNFQLPSKGFFDLGDIAALVDPALLKTEVVDVPGVDWDLRYDHENTHGKMLRIYNIDREGTFDTLFRRIEEKHSTN